jgi:hypothetical protein
VFSDGEVALRYYQDFKWRVIARLEQNAPWTLTEDEVREKFSMLRARHREEENGKAAEAGDRDA